jgi:TusA-related sulfurtransferase
VKQDHLLRLDVSELEPPQPMHQIIAALKQLQKGDVLMVEHRRKPIPLFEMIEGQYHYQCQEMAENQFRILFWPCKDPQAEQRAKILMDTDSLQ